MHSQLDEQHLAKIFRQMGEPSWWILSVLHPIDGLAGVQIIRTVENALRDAASPVQRLDPSTLHRALSRMERLKLVKRLSDRPVEVPIGHGATQLENRPVWIITGEGQQVLNRWQRTVSGMLRGHIAWSPSA